MPEAVLALGAEATLREAIGTPIEERDRAEHQETVLSIKTRLGEDRFQKAWVQKAWETGRALTMEAAVQYMLSDLPSDHPS